MERINQKIGRLREYLSLVRSIKGDCMAKFAIDPIYRGAMLHYLYLLADGCIALAELVIRHKNLRVPQSYSEAIDVLGESKILESSFAYEFAKIAGFRNFLAHDYEKVDAEFICKEIILKLDDIEVFIEQVKKSL